MKTTTEWLMEELSALEAKELYYATHHKVREKLIQQAKIMELERISNAYFDGAKSGRAKWSDAKEYAYNNYNTV
jgi:hypothetical protein